MHKRKMTGGLLIATSLILICASAAQQSPVEREILDLEAKMNAAYAANDLAAYFAYYAPDFTQWLPEGRTDLPQYEKEWTKFIQGRRQDGGGGNLRHAPTSRSERGHRYRKLSPAR
jgi:hypothetical protein